MFKCRWEASSGVFGKEGGNLVKCEEFCELHKCPLLQGERSLTHIMTTVKCSSFCPLCIFDVSPAFHVSPAEVHLTGQHDMITPREHGIASHCL